MRYATVEDWGLACACRDSRCDQEWQRLQIHEEPPRSQGGDPLDPLDCLPLCGRCHARRTGELGLGQTLRIEIASPIWRCRGPLVIRRSGEAPYLVVPWTRQQYPLSALPLLLASCGMERR